MKNSYDSLENYEVTAIIIGSIIGIGIFKMPSELVKISKQGAYFSVILGAIYPLYMVFASSYIIKHFPYENIVVISKRLFGKAIAYILNIIFCMQFVLYVVLVTSGLNNLLKTYVIQKISINKTTLIVLILVAYTSSKDIKALSQISYLMNIVSGSIILITLSALKYGSILNVQPIFSISLKDIIKGSFDTAYSYGGIEILLLIHPYIKNKNNVLKSSIKGVLITVLIYTWVVFGCIYYLGIEIVPKYLYPFISLTESLNIPLLNSFKYIFILLWAMILIKTIVNFYFGASLILDSLLNTGRNLWCLILLPTVYFITTNIPNEITRKVVGGNLIPLVTLFNIFFISLLTIGTILKEKRKKKVKYEKI